MDPKFGISLLHFSPNISVAAAAATAIVVMFGVTSHWCLIY